MDAAAKERAEKRMAKVDHMPREQRELVHEFGLSVVQAFLDCGVTKASRIRHLIETVKHGSTEVGDRRGQPNLMAEGWGRRA